MVNPIWQKAQASLERSLERYADRQRAAEKLQPTPTNFSQIKWLGMDLELAEWLEAAWKQEKFEAEDLEDLLEKIAPHFVNRRGKQFKVKSLAQNLRNKRLREAGRK